MRASKNGGYVMERIGSDCLAVNERIADLLLVAANDLTDGDHRTDVAQAAIHQLANINLHQALVNSAMAQGHIHDAEDAAMKLAAADKAALG